MSSAATARRPIVAANWKMHGDLATASTLATATREAIGRVSSEVVICPPFPYLIPVGTSLGGAIGLGAQDVHFAASGAHTGDVSASMLRDLGCRYAIVGHSERRTNHGETDEIVRRKAAALLEAGIRAIVCVGETLEQRESDQTEKVLERQLTGSLDGLTADPDVLVVAYEPVWAIGTGKTATPEMAQQAHAFIRDRLAILENQDVADAVRIQYGGSVKPGNAEELFACPDIDGGLIGGASLDAEGFAVIVRASASRRES
jgi:triosephosphate isomerase